MENNKIIYSLSIGDIQEVAIEEIGRNLTPDEIQKIIPLIEEKLTWFDAISEAITENIEPVDENESDEE